MFEAQNYYRKIPFVSKSSASINKWTEFDARSDKHAKLRNERNSRIDQFDLQKTTIAVSVDDNSERRVWKTTPRGESSTFHLAIFEDSNPLELVGALSLIARLRDRSSTIAYQEDRGENSKIARRRADVRVSPISFSSPVCLFVPAVSPVSYSTTPLPLSRFSIHPPSALLLALKHESRGDLEN